MTSLPVFIKTYDRDAAWLVWCLRSLRQNAPQFDPIVVATEPHCLDAARQAVRRADTCVELIDVWDVLPEARALSWSGYAHMVYCKLMGDVIMRCPRFFDIDSDSIVNRPISTADLGCPPCWLVRKREIAVREDSPWPERTEEALGFRSPYEFQGRALVREAATLRATREHLEARHGKTLIEYLNDPRYPRHFFPPRLSSSDTPGAWTYRFRPDRYQWADLDERGLRQRFRKGEHFITIGWSYAGLSPERERLIRDILEGRRAPVWKLPDEFGYQEL